MKSILESDRPAPLLVASATLYELVSRASKPAGGGAGLLFSLTVTESAALFLNSYSKEPTVFISQRMEFGMVISLRGLTLFVNCISCLMSPPSTAMAVPNAPVILISSTGC